MPGYKYDYVKYKWVAFLGKKILGEFKTKQEAMDCYDERAKQVFTFPILNNKSRQEDEPVPPVVEEEPKKKNETNTNEKRDSIKHSETGSNISSLSKT